MIDISQFDIPPAPTDKRRIVFSFDTQDNEFFKCFPSDNFLGTRYDRNPAQLLIVWDIFVQPYHCEMQLFTPRNQLLVSVPIPKTIATPYTIIDGLINEWVTKEEYINIQFVFTRDSGEFVKSTIPIRLELLPANRPEYVKIIKPSEFDRMKVIYDQAISKMLMRFDDVHGWVYDCFSCDGTLLFSLDWIPKGVVRCVGQVFTSNEKMVARSNIDVPFTFVLPLLVSDGTSVTKSITAFINELENATFEVWKDNGDGSFSEVVAVSKSYNATSVSVVLSLAINGYIRVSCKSARIEPDSESLLMESGFSGNVVMGGDEENVVVGEN